MPEQPINFKKFHNKIIGSLFHKSFYRYIITQKYRTLLVFYLILFLLCYLSPTLRTANLLQADNNVIMAFSDEILQEFPSLTIENSNLTQPEDLKEFINHPNFSYPIIEINQSASTVSAPPNQAAITFLEDSIIINKLCILDIFLNNLRLPHLSPNNLFDADNNHFVSYANDSYIIDAEMMREIIRPYTKLSSLFYLFLLASFIIFALFTISLRAVFYSIFTYSYAKNLKLELSYSQIYKLTLAALIPTTCLASLNVISLWSSNLLNNGTIASAIYLTANIYFSIFAVKSLTSQKA